MVKNNRTQLVGVASTKGGGGGSGKSEQGSPQFKKMKIRVGSQYQTRVQKLDNQTDLGTYVPLKRPAPELMSGDDPFLSKAEHTLEVERSGKPASIPESAFSAPALTNGHCHDKRSGGVLVHKAAARKQKDEYLWKCQQLMIPSSSSDIIENADSFQQEMFQLYGQTGRRTKKRRTMDSRQTLSTKPIIPKPMPSEHDEPMLEYLNTVGEAAYLRMRVDLQHGQAVKSRQSLHRELHSSRFRRPELTSTASWRQRCERTLPDMAGDYRSDPSVQSYAWRRKEHQKQSQKSSEENLNLLELDSNGLWRCVLAFGQALEKDRNKPSIAEVSDFLAYSYNMCEVEPEDVFGRHHVCVESIAKCMNSLLDKISDSRDAQAEMTDYLFENQEDGIDVDALQKLANDIASRSPLKLDDLALLQKKIDTLSDWQKRVDSLSQDEDQLIKAVGLVQEAKAFMLRTKHLTALEKKIEKANKLQERLNEWDLDKARGHKQTIKFVAALVRDANRIQLPSMKVTELLQFNQRLDAWIDRANIAIRSRISLRETESLISKAFTMPLDLSEYVDKLESRVRTAQEWITQLEELVPREEPLLNWMKAMRISEFENRLHDLASDGARIPVEMDLVKILQLELEAKNWSLRTQKWLPGGGESKKGKLEDLREHLVRGEMLRERVISDHKDKWVLDGEDQLTGMVNAADKWFEEYSQYLEWDSRRPNTRKRLSYTLLKKIVEESTGIYVSLGSPTNRMARVLAQADAWFEKHGHVVKKTIGTPEERGFVNHQEIADAVASAASDVAVDLEEAIVLKETCAKMKDWSERASFAAPKRSKRMGKSKLATKVVRYRVNDLVQLIEEADDLPADTREEVDRLKRQLNDVHTWRIKAHGDLKGLIGGFKALASAIEVKYGSEADFQCGDSKDNENEDGSSLNDPIGGDSDVKSKNRSQTSGDNAMDTSDNDSKGDDSDVQLGTRGNSNVIKSIESLLSEGKQSGVLTTEEELASDLQEVSKWCFKSLKFLERPRDLYEKRAHRAFDTFVKAGGELVDAQRSRHLDDSELEGDLKSSWMAVVSSQLVRLRKLQAHRDEFSEWSKKAHPLISSKEKRLSLKAIQDLAQESHRFPATADMVQRVRNLFHRMERWRESVTALFNSGSKIVMADASALHNEGEKLKIACDEMKVLRNGMKATRIWLGKVKKCNFESGATSSADVEKLIEEHDNLLISAPEEAEKLSTAVKNYCLCRRPYEGFMIGCDDCGEWYHGACIGMSETQAGRYEKFLCVRCGVKKVFTKSAASIASIVRKWTSVKDFKKARQVESQKHQRKVRKERKDIEKFESQISEFQTKLLNFARSKQTIHPNHSNGFTNGMQHVQFLQSEIYQSAPSHSAINNVAPTFESSSIMNSQQSLAPSMGNSLHHMQGVLNPQYTQSQDPNKGGQSIQNGEKIAGVTEGGTTAEDKQPEPEVVTPERAEEMGQKVIEWQKCIISCNERLDMLSRKSEERTLVDAEEEQCRELLKIWCIRVRRFVLAPVMLEQANASRPCTDGSMSGPMINLFRDAEALGIAKLPDVHFIANSLKCISWSCLAMSTLATRPRKEEIQNLVKFCDSLELPDEKAARVLKGMVVRTSQFQLKVQKALAPKPGENRPFNLDVLKSLEATSALLPFGVFESNLLMAALEDKGCRHCLCGGPNDGSFMLSCDKCELWFHGRCVGVTKTTGEKLDKWMCPPCAGQNDFVVPDSALKFNFSEWEKDDDESSSTSTNDIAPCAPVPEKLWPPFGLLNSPQALEALGEECVSIHDSIGDWEGFRLPDKHVLPMADHGSLARQVPIARPLVSVVADQTTNFVPSPTVHDYHSSNAPVNGGTMHSAEAIQHSYPPNSIQNGSVLVSSAGRVVSTDPMYQSSFATIKEKMMFKSNGFSDSKTILSNVTKSKCVDEGAHVVTPDFQHGLVDNGCVDNAAEMITSSRKDDNQHMPLSGVSHIEVPHGESSIGVNPSASIVSITKNEPTPSDVVTSALLATVKMPPKTVVTKSDIPVQSQSLNKCLSSTLPTALHGEAGGTEKRAESTSVTVAHLSGKTVRSPEVPVPVP